MLSQPGQPQLGGADQGLGLHRWRPAGRLFFLGADLPVPAGYEAGHATHGETGDDELFHGMTLLDELTLG
jgi:hypothetical protein